MKGVESVAWRMKDLVMDKGEDVNELSAYLIM